MSMATKRQTGQDSRRRPPASGSGSTFRDQMQLPEGKTCNDCYAFQFCIGIGCTSHGATHCDYWPNRFRPNYLFIRTEFGLSAYWGTNAELLALTLTMARA